MPGDENDDDFMSRHFPDARKIKQTKLSPASSKPPPHKRPPEPFKRAPEPPVRIHDDTTASEILSYTGNGIQQRVMAQLRRGALPIGDRLDLHGLNVNQAHREVTGFIRHCRSEGHRCALIIHGRGARSEGKVPVLKMNLKSWLTEHPDVLAFHSATQRDGGTGAVYILLRTAAGRRGKK